MANISDAVGNVIVCAPSKDDVLKVIQILNKYLSNIGDYSQTIFEPLDTEQFKQYPAFPNNEKSLLDGFLMLTGVNTSFAGSGRWVFEENIKKMMGTLTTLNSFEKADQNYLESIPWLLSYDYIDCEPGCCVFYNQKSLLYHRAGTVLTEAVYIDNYASEHIDYNFGNLMRYGFRDTVDEALDYIGYSWYIDEIHNGDIVSKEHLKDHLVRGTNSYAAWKGLDASDVKKMLYETSDNFKECYDALHEKEED